MSSRDLLGIVNLNKPVGMTSRDAVNVVQRLVRPAKVGHAGTLDPLAEGVLRVCVGPATRLVPYIQQQRKTYRATFRLGMTSDTDDITGSLTTISETPGVTTELLQQTLQQFVGRIEQVPPQVSAVHVDGKRAYALARQGQEFKLEAKTVEIDSITLLQHEGADFSMEMVCGGGTYVRSVGRDLGAQLGCGAVMTSLVRTRIGAFGLDSALPVEQLTSATLLQHLQPARTAVADFPPLTISQDESIAIRCGRSLSRPLPDSDPDAGHHREYVLLDAAGEFIALAAAQPAANELSLQPRIVFPASSSGAQK